MSVQLSRRGLFRALGGVAGALVLPPEPAIYTLPEPEGLERTGRVYSFASELRVPGDEDVAALDSKYHPAVYLESLSRGVITLAVAGGLLWKAPRRRTAVGP